MSGSIVVVPGAGVDAAGLKPLATEAPARR